MKQSQTSRSSRRGVAYVMALILLALCFSLAVAMASATNLNLRRSDNLHVAMDAQLAAESGLAFATLTMEGVQSDRYWDGNTPDIMPIIHTHLSARLNQTANISGQPLPDAVDTNGDGLDDLILTPSIPLSGQGAFTFRIEVNQRDGQSSLPTQLQLRVTGTAGQASRTVAVLYEIIEDTRVLSYSVSSRPRMIICGNSVVEGEVYSTWTRTYFSGHYIPPFLLEPESTVEGKMRTVMSQEEFEQYNSGSAIEGTHEGVEHDEPSFTEYSTADFDTSAYRTQAANTLAASDDVQVSWFPDDSNKTRKFDRHNYQGQIFENTYIPAGRNAHFTNCTFRGVLFVETNETKTLGNWPYNKVRSHHWLQRDRHNTLSNNIVFENCRFEGKIVTAVPREFWWTKNSMTFTGSTVFDVPAGTDTTILAPNFNINIGDFNNGDSNSTVDGILVGGIVDIRDNAEINGTIMSMADLGDSLGSSIRHYGTNVGYYEGDVEGGYPQVTSHIRITPQPDNPLPLGIRKRCFARLVSNSYTEAAP